MKAKIINPSHPRTVLLIILSLVFGLSIIVQGQQYTATYTTTVPTIDGQINSVEWQNANVYNITFFRNDGGGSHQGVLYLQNNGTWLFIGIESEWNSGWDVYLQLRFDGNNDNILSGNSYIPHTDIQVEYPSPDGWSGYNNYQYIVGTNSYSTNEPTGTQRASSGSTNVTYEYKVKIEDLNTNSLDIFGFYMLHGTDGTSSHDYEFPDNSIRNNPSQWTEILLEGPAPTYVVPYIPNVSLPIIDGQISPGEWQYANSYNISFYRTDGGNSHAATLYFQRDADTWLYIAVQSNWAAGWDVYMQLRFDGNNDNILSGNSYVPHTDIQVECPSLTGWSGYNNYQYIVGTNTYTTNQPSGTLRASNGNTNAIYEYKINITDLGIDISNIQVETFGFYLLHGTDGTSQHDYEFPSNNIRNNPSQWVNVLFDPPLNLDVLPNVSENIDVYPNPLTTKLNLTLNNSNFLGSNILIFNSQGQTVISKTIAEITTTLDLGYFSNGIYLLLIKKANHYICIKKIVKL